MRALALLLASSVALAGAGCGSRDAVDPANVDVAQAADATANAKTAKITIRVRTKSDALPTTIGIDGTGQVDLVSRRLRLTARFAGLPAGGGAASTTRIEEILDGTTLYMRSSLFASMTGPDKWLKFDLRRLGSRLGVNFSQLLQSGSSDPTQGLSYLRAASDKVEKIGTEDVRGTPTTHYRAVIDLERYPGVVPPAQRRAARQNVEQIKKLTGQSEIPEDVWLDSANRVRRFSTVQNISSTTGPAAGTRARVETRGELYDFGAPVSVAAPPASQTRDASKLLSGALGG